MNLRYRLAVGWLVGALSLRAATGLIGSVSLPPGWVAEVAVEVTDEAEASKHFTGRPDAERIFRFPDLPPGLYSMKIVSAHHEGKRRAVRILPGALTDVGAVALQFPECATQVCQGGGPDLFPYMGQAVKMTDLCAVDLYVDKHWCIVDLGLRGPIQPQDKPQRAFWFHSAPDGVYLVPLQGVAFSPNPSTVTYKHGCPNATYVQDRIRIDNLQPHSRACVRTKSGDYLELQFPETIAPNQEIVNVELWDLGH